MKILSLLYRKEAEYASGYTPVFDMQKIDPLYNEMFKGLRAKVEHKIDMLELKSLAVTSAVAGEGKTLTAINLAVNMANTGRKRVLLMDLDLRKPSIAGMMDIAAGPGLSEYLSGAVSKDEIIQKSTFPGLFIIPAGKTLSSPADLLAGEKLRSLLRDIRVCFDLVITDTPPVLPVPDALTLSEQLDAFIMLFRLMHTPHQLFRKAMEELGERKIMGVVLNGEEKKTEKYYSRYYGKYYTSIHSEGNDR